MTRTARALQCRVSVSRAEPHRHPALLRIGEQSGGARRTPSGGRARPGGDTADVRARRRFRALPALLLVALLALTGCAADPQPAPPPETNRPTEPVTAPTRVVVGVDDLGPGFNPHLRSDQSAVTTAIASMTLPSVFRPDDRGVPPLDHTAFHHFDECSRDVDHHVTVGELGRHILHTQKVQPKLMQAGFRRHIKGIPGCLVHLPADLKTMASLEPAQGGIGRSIHHVVHSLDHGHVG